MPIPKWILLVFVFMISNKVISQERIRFSDNKKFLSIDFFKKGTIVVASEYTYDYFSFEQTGYYSTRPPYKHKFAHAFSLKTGYFVRKRFAMGLLIDYKYSPENTAWVVYNPSLSSRIGSEGYQSIGVGIFIKKYFKLYSHFYGLLDLTFYAARAKVIPEDYYFMPSQNYDFNIYAQQLKAGFAYQFNSFIGLEAAYLLFANTNYHFYSSVYIQQLSTPFAVGKSGFHFGFKNVQRFSFSVNCYFRRRAKN